MAFDIDQYTETSEGVTWEDLDFGAFDTTPLGEDTRDARGFFCTGDMGRLDEALVAIDYDPDSPRDGLVIDDEIAAALSRLASAPHHGPLGRAQLRFPG